MTDTFNCMANFNYFWLNYAIAPNCRKLRLRGFIHHKRSNSKCVGSTGFVFEISVSSVECCLTCTRISYGPLVICITDLSKDYIFPGEATAAICARLAARWAFEGNDASEEVIRPEHLNYKRCRKITYSSWNLLKSWKKHKTLYCLR